MARWSILKPSKQSIKPRNVFGYDIETVDDGKTFLCATITQGDDYWQFKDKFECIKFLKTARFRAATIITTMLQYDFNGTFFGTEEMKNFRLLPKGSDWLSMTTYLSHKDPSFTHEKVKGVKSDKIVWLDTLNYAQMSVEQLGKILGLPKMVKPKAFLRRPENAEEWREMLEYNRRDAQVSEKFFNYLAASFEKLGATVKTTIAATALSLFKNKYLKNDYFRHSPEELLELFEGYYGGRTEAFGRGLIKDYHVYDYNSLYPSVMLDYKFPDPNTKRVTRSNKTEYIEAFEGLSRVTVIVPESMEYPLLPYRDADERLLFPVGEFTAWQSHVELREAVKHGVIIKKVWKTYYYSGTCEPFKEFVTDLYSLRQKFKQENNPMELVTKLLMNSLYGKFGQRFDDKEGILHESQLTMDEINLGANIEQIGDSPWFRKKAMREPSAFCVPIWSLYVTAYARLKLWDDIMKYRPVYVDTDSLFTQKIIPDSKELGLLKFEKTLKECIIVRPKMYGDSENLAKIKGVRKKLVFEEFKNLLVVRKVSFEKFAKFKESLRRGLIPNERMIITKTLDLEDVKREWPKPFNPHEFQTSRPRIIFDEVVVTPNSRDRGKSLEPVRDSEQFIERFPRSNE